MRWKYYKFNSSKPQEYYIIKLWLVHRRTRCVYTILKYYRQNTSCNPDCDSNSGMTKILFDTLLSGLGTLYHVLQRDGTLHMLLLIVWFQLFSTPHPMI
ncbi:hypothetical protein RRG08_057874 [Elysia crispata]|uniref:Uncharacterized protein n=1 Tax=Elysia crispata TaxID=231223 RepID=A0AAE1B224_9GAST|nr:hypothetical protein RRG08_057874 [Elysia crispata]